MQGKLASKMLESEFTPQPIDECLGSLGSALVHQEALSAVISIYAQGMKGAEVSAFPLHAADHLASSSLSAKLSVWKKVLGPLGDQLFNVVVHRAFARGMLTCVSATYTRSVPSVG